MAADSGKLLLNANSITGLDDLFQKVTDTIIAERFGLPYPMPPAVHLADRTALFIEQRDLMPPHDDAWARADDIREDRPEYQTITAQSPLEARSAFLARYAELTAPVVECDCGGGWSNGRGPDSTHSRYCARFGNPEYSVRVLHPWRLESGS